VSSKSSGTTHGAGVLDRQFGHPAGALGALVGAAMALEHRQLHRAVVDRLGLGAADRVLEVGFGPGTALRLAATRAAFVAGIDPSREMVRQATRRNRAAIRRGRVEVLRARACAIPYPNDSFTVVFEVNSFHHWESPETGLREIRRVLKPGGRLLMSLYAHHGDTLPQQIRRLTDMLQTAGFRDIASEEGAAGPGGAFVTAQG